MDFFIGLPKSVKGHEAIWVIVDRSTKPTHFLSVHMTFSMDQFARMYVKKWVKLNGITVSIVPDRDPRFTELLEEFSLGCGN